MTTNSELRGAGFTSEDVRSYVEKNRTTWNAAGFSNKEINTEWDVVPFDEKEVQGLSKELVTKEQFGPAEGKSTIVEGREVENGKLKPIAYDDVSFADAFASGFQQSIPGLLVRQQAPDIALPDKPHIAKRIAAQTSALVGDLPFMVGGAILGGGPLSPITATGGAFGLPAGLRKILTDKYTKGEVTSFSDFWGRLTGAVYETAKGEATGIVTGAAGKVAPIGWKAPAEITAMVTSGAALEGRIPEPEEFIDATILIGGLRATRATTQKIYEQKLYGTYNASNTRPSQVIEDIKTNPQIVEDLYSKNLDIPRQYTPPGMKEVLQTDFKKAKEITPKEKPIEEKVSGKEVTDPKEPTSQDVLDNLSINKKTINVPSVSDLYTWFVDDLHPIQRLVKQFDKKGNLPTEENPYRLARLMRGVNGLAEHFLEFGTFDFKTRRNNGKPIREILEPVKKDLDDFRRYMTSRRVVELNKRDIETGIDIELANQTIKNLDSKFREPLNELFEYQDRVLNYLKDSEIIDTQTYNAFKVANENYIPFYRVVDVESGGLSKGLKVRQPIKGIKGSEKTIIDPLESIIKNTYLYISLAERNRTGKAIVGFAKDVKGFEDVIKKRKGKSVKISISQEEIQKKLGLDVEVPGEVLEIFRENAFTPEPNTIAVWEKGKRTVYDVPQDVADAFHGINSESISLTAKILAYPAKFLRAGATLSPEFIGRNPIRDQFAAFIFSKHGFIPGYDFMKGIAHVGKQDKVYQEWLKSGGANSMLVSMDRNYIQSELQSLLTASPIRNLVKNPLELLRITAEFGEVGTRIGEFQKAQRAGESLQGSGFSSREVTLDFQRKGAKTKAMNMITAFWNANIQGTDKIIRELKNHPAKATAKAVASISIPSLLLTLANHDDPRWKEIKQWQKDLYWIALEGEMTTKRWDKMSPEQRARFNEENTVYRIPKPHTLGIIFGTSVERMTEFMLTQDPESFDGFLESMYKSVAPSVLPTASVPLIENWANKSIFTDGPIVPYEREKLLPEYQYTKYTTELSKSIGALITEIPLAGKVEIAKPAKFENLVRGWSGGLGVYALQLADLALRKTGALESPIKPTPTLADIPFVKAFVVRNPSASTKSIERFYKDFGEANEKLETAKFIAQREFKTSEALDILLTQPVALDSVKNSLSNMNRMVDFIYMNQVISEDEKRQLIDTVYEGMVLTAQQGNKLIKQINKELGK